MTAPQPVPGDRTPADDRPGDSDHSRPAPTGGYDPDPVGGQLAGAPGDAEHDPLPGADPARATEALEDARPPLPADATLATEAPDDPREA
jgi:hypothetical protein